MSDEITADQKADTTSPKNDGEAAKYRRKYRETKAENDGLKTRVADLEGKLSVATGEGAAQRIAELEAQIRTRTHKDAFGRLAAGKIKPDAMDDAFALLSGWKVESDDVDENSMGEAITSLVDAKPYLKVQETKSEPADTGTPAPVERSFSLTGYKPKPVPGAGRGPAPEATPKNTKSAYRL